MRKSVVVLFIIGLLSSCQSKDLVKKDKITKIVLMNNQRQFVISNNDSIVTVLIAINNAVYDPAVFYPEYEVDIYYDCLKVKSILCYSNRMKIDGKCYKLNKPLKDYFK